MDVWWNNHFSCNDLESSNWNNHNKLVVWSSRHGLKLFMVSLYKDTIFFFSNTEICQKIVYPRCHRWRCFKASRDPDPASFPGWKKVDRLDPDGMAIGIWWLTVTTCLKYQFETYQYTCPKCMKSHVLLHISDFYRFLGRGHRLA